MLAFSRSQGRSVCWLTGMAHKLILDFKSLYSICRVYVNTISDVKLQLRLPWRLYNMVCKGY